MRLADGPLACVGCHVVDVHPDPFVGGRRYLEVLWIVTSIRAALLDTCHVPGFGDSSVVSSPGLDYRLGYQHLRRYVPPRGQPVVDRDSLHDVAAAVDRACVALYCGLAVAGVSRIWSGPRTAVAAATGSVRASTSTTSPEAKNTVNE